MQRAYRTKLRLTAEQTAYFYACAGVARFVYNWALADRKQRREQGLSTSKFEQKKRFNALKLEQFPWLAEYPYVIVERAFDDLQDAYTHFFRRIKEGKEKAGFPRFKSRHTSRKSFCLGQNSVIIETGRIKLPKVGWVNLAENGYIPCTGSAGVKLNRATVSERAGAWFISVQVEEPDPEPLAVAGTVGVDLGIKSLAVTSDGASFDNPKTLTRFEKRMARLQRELHRRVKGSRNRVKTKDRIAKLHAKISNVRSHTLHNISAHVVYDLAPERIVVEDLNVKGMTANHHLAKAVIDASMGELRRQIEYKAQWAGAEVIVADRWYASSKTCSNCGHVKEVLSLSERIYVCEVCGVILDRDHNAALNLAAYAR
jgi:putative transposase